MANLSHQELATAHQGTVTDHHKAAKVDLAALVATAQAAVKGKDAKVASADKAADQAKVAQVAAGQARADAQVKAAQAHAKTIKNQKPRQEAISAQFGIASNTPKPLAISATGATISVTKMQTR